VTTQSRLFLQSVCCELSYIHHAQCYLDYLEDSGFLEDLDHIVGRFDKTTKLRFRTSNEPQYIKFGGAGDNDPNCNIRFGQLRLLGSDVAMFFEPSVECIVKSVLDQCKVAHPLISVRISVFLVTLCPEPTFQHVVLVGGFAASDWLFTQICDKLLPHGLNIIRPENHVSVLSSFEIRPILTWCSGTRLCLMAPFPSITTVLYALGSLSLLMDISATSYLIPWTWTI